MVCDFARETAPSANHVRKDLDEVRKDCARTGSWLYEVQDEKKRLAELSEPFREKYLSLEEHNLLLETKAAESQASCFLVPLQLCCLQGHSFYFFNGGVVCDVSRTAVQQPSIHTYIQLAVCS